MKIKESLRKMMKLLTFRISREELSSINRGDLAVGLICAWVVGIGRYWDDPSSNWHQRIGAGSVVYVFILSGLLWLILKPFKITGWRYERLLTFVSLTSAPAIVYAVPVERFYDVVTPAVINAYFLAAVGAWRVALWMFFLRRSAQLPIAQTIVATFLPLTLIVTLLTLLNLEHVAFDLMSGIRTSHDFAYYVSLAVTTVSMVMCIPLSLAYVVIVRKRRKANIGHAGGGDCSKASSPR